MTVTEHLLACLAEECAEIQQLAMKALRFGCEDKAPGDAETNVEKLAVELGDLLAVVALLRERGLPLQYSTEAVERKKAKVERYMAYAEQRGVLER